MRSIRPPSAILVHRSTSPHENYGTDCKFLYGHVWVGLARLVRHPTWGTIGLPILSHLYIRAKDLAGMAAYYGWEFRTKLERAAALVEWLVQQLGTEHPPVGW